MKIKVSRAWAIKYPDCGIYPYTISSAKDGQGDFNMMRIVMLKESDWRKIAKHLKKYPMEDSDAQHK